MSAVPASTPHAGPGPVFFCCFRSGAGQIDLNFPIDRIPEALEDSAGTLWLDILDEGGKYATDVETLFRDVFQFHPLAIEDALQEANHPKLDDWDRYLYTVFHAIDFDSESDEVCLHELDAFLGRAFLVTYHTEPLAVVDKVRELVLRDSENRLKRRPDHLLYLLIDRGVDEHLAAIEHLDEAIDSLMDEILEKPRFNLMSRIYQIKRSVARVYRIIVPQREVANRLARDPYPQIGERDRLYFRDAYDGLVRLHNLVEGVRDLVSGAIDTYLSTSANRTNEIMKTLTIVTVLFLPLNFLAGFFGMNFFSDNIALDSTHPGHVALFAASCVIMLGSVLAFWWWGHRRGWY
jgi:magnesium transporter